MEVEEVRKRTRDIALRFGVVALLLYWSFRIVMPFLVPLLWGAILAVTLHPAYERLVRSLGNRRKLGAWLLTLALLAALIVPSVMLTNNLIDGLGNLAHQLRTGELAIPPPSEKVKSYPRLHRLWADAASDLDGTLNRFQPQLKQAGEWLLGAVGGLVHALLEFIFAIIVAGFLFVYWEKARSTVLRVSERLFGAQGAGFVETSASTIRSVVKGVIGVAVIQALLLGISFKVVGVPFAGVWALVGLLLGIVQIGVLPVLIGAVVYIFAHAATATAWMFLVWSIFLTLFDEVLKVLLLGHGAKAPMLIVVIGAIGGLLAAGFLGLFVGAVVFVIVYELFLTWLTEGQSPHDVVSSPSPSPHA